MDTQQCNGVEAMRTLLDGEAGISEKRMFGRHAFMLNGNMLCTAGGERFLFRVGKDQEAEALKLPGTSVMIMRGRPMGGYISVEADAALETGLDQWIAMARGYVAALPGK